MAAVVLLTPGIFVLAGTADASMAGGPCDLPAGDLAIADLPEGTSAVECDAVGREVQDDGLELTIPDPGNAVQVEQIYPGGADIFAVTVEKDGTVSYDTGDTTEADAMVAAGGAETGTSTKIECLQGDAWNLNDERQDDTWNWYVGDGYYPAGLGYVDFANLARDTLANIRQAYNDCGFIDKVTELHTQFQGKTTYEGDFVTVDGVTKCGNRDGVSTVDAGNLDKNGHPPLALECTWWKVNQTNLDDIIESDIRFDIKDYDFTTTPGNCSGKWDVQALLTHEFGHSVGLGHVSEDLYPTMTMSTDLAPCNGSARTLGQGDIHGLQNLYCISDSCHYVTKG